MIRAIIFDCFGVLTSEGWIPFRDEYFGSVPSKLEQANGLMRQLTTGQIHDDTFHDAIAKLAGTAPELVKERMYDNKPSEALFDYIRTLKPRYTFAMLSNVGKNRLSEIFTPAQLALIDVFALSSEIGYAKPEPKAYETTADRIGLRPQECLFTDDKQEYIDGAHNVGMHGILYQDFLQFKADLERLI